MDTPRPSSLGGCVVAMSRPRPTLPGEIPGLLRRGSPVLRRRNPLVDWVVSSIASDGMVWLAGAGEVCPETLGKMDGLMLDLTDPTGRAHAAWWVRGYLAPPGVVIAPQPDTEWYFKALFGEDMRPREIAELVAVVKHYAGVRP